MIRMRPLLANDDLELEQLARAAKDEGFAFVQRLRSELETGSVERDGQRSFFIVIESESRVIGVGGVTPDPYIATPDVGRVRHVYIAPAFRNQGLGQQLVAALELCAAKQYKNLRLRTDTLAAARFYERAGYTPVEEESATHRKQLHPDRRN